MKPKEKAQLIENKINNLNNSILKEKKWKLGYVNRQANDYCLVVISRKKEIFNGSFATYDSVLSALNLLEFIFSKALNERK